MATCACRKYNTGSLVQRWQARSLATVRRLIARGHTVNGPRMAETVALIALLEAGDASAYRRDDAHSHHLPNCPFKQRAVSMLDTVSSDS